MIIDNKFYLACFDANLPCCGNSWNKWLL